MFSFYIELWWCRMYDRLFWQYTIRAFVEILSVSLIFEYYECCYRICTCIAIKKTIINIKNCNKKWSRFLCFFFFLEFLLPNVIQNFVQTIAFHSLFWFIWWSDIFRFEIIYRIPSPNFSYAFAQFSLTICSKKQKQKVIQTNNPTKWKWIKIFWLLIWYELHATILNFILRVNCCLFLLWNLLLLFNFRIYNK